MATLLQLPVLALDVADPNAIALGGLPLGQIVIASDGSVWKHAGAGLYTRIDTSVAPGAYLGAHNPATNYTTGQMSSSGGFLWIANRNNVGVTPVEGADWSKISTNGIQGPAGPQGLQGIQGEQGEQGIQGIQGDTGEAGSVWYSGVGAPAAGLGIVSDRYLNTANGDHYEKTALATWTLRGNLKGDTGPTGAPGEAGAQGEQGEQGEPGPAGAPGDAGPAGAPGHKWYTGAGAPGGGVGVIGDWYLNGTNGDYYEKTGAAAWTLRGNIKGPPGDAGPQGDPGEEGPPGPPGGIPLDAPLITHDVPAAELTGAKRLIAGLRTSITETATEVLINADLQGGGGGSGVPGAILAQTDLGLVGDGIANDATDLIAWLATVGSSPAHLHFEDGRYLLGTSFIFPKNVKLTKSKDARLQVPTAGNIRIGIRGILDIGMEWFFEFPGGLANTGLFEFSDETELGGAIKRGVLIDGIYPNNFGAQSDGADDTVPIKKWRESIEGYPKNTNTTPRVSTQLLKLAPQSTYETTLPVRFAQQYSAVIDAAGIGSSSILMRGGTTGTATNVRDDLDAFYNVVELDALYAAGSLLGQIGMMGGADTTWAGLFWWVIGQEEFDSGGGVMKTRVMIEGDPIGLGFVWPGANQTFYIMQPAVIELSGAFDVSLKGLTIGPAPESFCFCGVYYHRDSAETTLGSSLLRCEDVRVQSLTGTRMVRGWQIGSFDGNLYWQEDNSAMNRCHAHGFIWNHDPASMERRLWWKNGWYYGTSGFGNNLNHENQAGIAVGWKYGVTIAATNLKWTGTVDVCECNLYLIQAAQIMDVGNMRTEGSWRHVDGFTGQASFQPAKMGGIEYSCDSLRRDVVDGTYDLIRWPLGGTLLLENWNIWNFPSWGGGNEPNAIYSGFGVDVDGNGYVDVPNNPLVAGDWAPPGDAIMDIGNPFSNQTYKVLDNTNGRIKIVGNWTTGERYGAGVNPPPITDPTRRVSLYRLPRIRQTQASVVTNIVFQGFGTIGFKLEDMFAGGNFLYESHGVGYKDSGGTQRQAGDNPRTANVRHVPADYGTQSTAFYPEWTKNRRHEVRLSGDFDQDMGGGTFPPPNDHVYHRFPPAGTVIELDVVQDGVGGRTMTLTSTRSFKNATTGASAATLVTGGAGKTAHSRQRWELEYRPTHILARLIAEYPG